MTWTTLALGKRIMTDGKQQSLGRAAMGVMAAQTGIASRTNSLMNADKSRVTDGMAFGA